MEKLWQEYLRAEYGNCPPPVLPAAAGRHAFFFGAWSLWVFHQRLAALSPESAAQVHRTLELELAREVCAANLTANDGTGSLAA